MKRFLCVVAIIGVVFSVSHPANADVWRWNDSFIAAFVDAEGINRHPGSSEQGEQFDGQMFGTRDVAGPGVDVYYDLVDAAGNPVDNSVAGLEVWKPDGADWLGQGATSGLGLVTQWGKELHMDASGLDSLELPLWYKSGQGPLNVRVFCVTGASSGAWVETQMDSATVTLNQGESALLTADLTAAPDRTRMVKVGVVIEAHDGTMLGKKAKLHIGSVPVETVTLENYGPNSAYRWMDVADQTYSVAFQNSYTYDDAGVQVTYNTVGQQLVGTLTATNLKPNFAYQFKLIGESTYKPGDANDGCNELIGLNGRWWEQEWTGSSWTAGWNLNNKGNGTSPNPNDNTYYDRRDITDSSSPTGLNYKYTAYRVFEYFITDENGNASLSYTVNNCYHVLFKTPEQGTPGANDGPVVTRTFDVNPSIHTQYDTDYRQKTVGIFGEWERLPKNGVGLRPGDYTCYMLLTEESFHGSGLQGWWAHAMKGQARFTILPEANCKEPIKGDLNDDCKVDFQDIVILVTNAWLTTPTSLDWNPQADLAPATLDDLVNLLDFAVLAEHWRETTH